MADIITAIVDALNADLAVAALVGAHGYGEELPNEAVKLMPRGAFVVRPSGGAPFQPRSKVNAEAQRFDLVCYGATPYEADRLRRTASPVLLGVERRLVGSVLIHWVQSAGGYLTGRDRDGKWPYAFQSFQTLFAAKEIT